MDILKLKKQSNGTRHCYFYVLKMKESGETRAEAITKVLLASFKDTTDFQVEVMYSGDLHKFPNYKDVVGKFKKKAQGGGGIYRDYGKTEEEQRKAMAYCYCIVAEESSTSWNTAINALNSSYGAVIKIYTNNEID